MTIGPDDHEVSKDLNVQIKIISYFWLKLLKLFWMWFERAEVMLRTMWCWWQFSSRRLTIPSKFDFKVESNFLIKVYFDNFVIKIFYHMIKINQKLSLDLKFSLSLKSLMDLKSSQTTCYNFSLLFKYEFDFWLNLD